MKYLIFILTACSFLCAQQGGQFGQGAVNNGVNLTQPGSGNHTVLLYQVSALQTPATPTVTYTGTAGAGTWGYKIVIFDAYGNQASVPSAQGSCSSAATTLDASHTCTVPCTATWSTFDGNVATCNIYRTASAGTPANLSLVCTGTALGANCIDNGSVNTASVTPGVFVGTASALTVNAYTVAASQLQPGKCLRVTVDFSHSTGTASVSYTLLYGAGSSGANASATTLLLSQTGMVCDEPGQTGQQSISLRQGAVPVDAEVAIDSTVAKTLAWQFNVASTDQITPKVFRVELLQ